MQRKIIKGVMLLLLCFSFTASFSQQFKALLFTKTDGFHHESILDGVTTIRQLGSRNNFTVDWHENATIFNDKALENYAVVIFLNTTGNILTEEQQAAFEKFIRAGKGFVGIHSASDTEYEWPWYTKMVGMMFKIHPQNQTAWLKVENSSFPGMERIPARLMWTDEWYEFGERKSDDLKFLLSVDEKTYNPYAKWGEKEGKGMGTFHPISWYHPYDGGRAFYTALGHIPLTFNDQIFQNHIYGGIYWAATGKGL